MYCVQSTWHQLLLVYHTPRYLVCSMYYYATLNHRTGEKRIVKVIIYFWYTLFFMHYLTYDTPGPMHILYCVTVAFLDLDLCIPVMHTCYYYYNVPSMVHTTTTTTAAATTTTTMHTTTSTILHFTN